MIRSEDENGTGYSKFTALLILTIIIAGCNESSEITDPQEVLRKTIDTLADTESYHFNISSSLIVPSEGKLELLRSDGYVDYRDRRMKAVTIVPNRTVEIIIIDQTAYLRESLLDPWRKRELNRETASLWQRDFDVLEQQRSVLLNATNVTLEEEEDGWILGINPGKAALNEQLKNQGIMSIKESDLKNFNIRYRVDRDYHITMIENRVELDMNIQGFVTPMVFISNAELGGFDQFPEIKTPIP